MEKYKILVINDEGDDLSVEQKVIAENVHDSDIEIELKYIPAVNSNEINKHIVDADGINIIFTKCDESLIGQMKKCKIIATQSIGFNTIDLKAATDHQIYVTNVPDFCIEDVALHTVTLALACVRKVVEFDYLARNKPWKADEIYKLGKTYRIKDKTYGIVSFGNIGRRVAEIVKIFGMKVVAFDPYVSDAVFTQACVEKIDSMEELLQISDIVSIHTPLTPNTKNMIDSEKMKYMKKNAILINTSRGGVIDEQALCTALEEGRIAYAGVDVIEDETTYQSPLYSQNKTIITPHVGFYSEESLEEGRRKAMQQIIDVLVKKQVPQYLVNKDVVAK